MAALANMAALALALVWLVSATAAADAQTAPPGWRLVGTGLWFSQTGQPRGWDWSSRFAGSAEECAAICPNYRQTYGCKSFFYRPPYPDETNGHCELLNFDTATGLRVEPDTIHGQRSNFEYYERANGEAPVTPPEQIQAYECRWDKVAGPGGAWTTGWVPDHATPECGHMAAGCACPGQNYCGKYPAGASTYWWTQGCGVQPWTIRCSCRPAGEATEVPGISPPGTAEPCDTPKGQACLEEWIALFARLANGYDGSDDYNGRKPWSINRYGLMQGGTAAGPFSAFAPDDFPQYRNNRCHWMWGHPDIYTASPFPEAGVPDLQPYIESCMNR